MTTSTSPRTAEEIRNELLEEIEKRATERSSALIDELRGELEEAKKTLDEQRSQVERLTAAGDEFAKLSGAPPQGTGKGEYSMMRLFVAVATRDWSGAELEKEVSDEMRKKAMSLGVDTAGGFLVPENYTAEIIEQLEQNNPLLQMGVRQLPASGAPFKFPKQTGSATATYSAEGTTISASNPTYGQIEFNPHGLKSLVRVSNTLRENATPEIEAEIRRDMAQQFDNAITTYGLTGNGGGGQPIGILNEPNVNNVDFSTATATYDKLVDMVHEVSVDNALRGRLGWIMHPNVKRDIWKMRDAGSPVDQQLERRVLAEGPLTTLLGYPFAETTAMPSTEQAIVFGGWDQMLMPMWKVLEVRASDVAGTTFETDEMAIRGILRNDFGVRHAEAFCYSLNYAA